MMVDTIDVSLLRLAYKMRKEGLPYASNKDCEGTDIAFSQPNSRPRNEKDDWTRCLRSESRI